MKRSIHWGNFTAGDTIITLGGEQARVLGRLGLVIVRSGWFNFDTYGEIVSIADAKKKGWRFIQKDGKVPMTKEEIERFFGRPIEII